MEEKIFKESDAKMERALSSLKTDLNKVRTGRASLALFDDIRIDYYGTSTPIQQLASLAVPESRLITIQPWDTTIIGEIERAILKSDLGLTPVNDGKIIRIPIPPLTEQRRKELAKMAKKMAEEGKISIRNQRRETNELFKELKNEKEISEDELFRYQDDVQKTTDEFIKKVDEVTAEKEKEIMEF